MSAAQVGERLCFRLSEQEYKGFLRWYKKDFLKEKDLGRVRPDFMNLKEDCCITMENEVIRIQTGNTDIWLLYSALTEVHRKEGLILFFGQKEFWAIPERVLGGDLEAQEWFRCLNTKCLENRDGRIPMGDVEEACRRRTVPFCCYTRSVDQIADACRALGLPWRNVQKLRKAALFPYRYVGLQLLALEEDGICEYGERSVVRHAYGDFEKAVYTPEYVYLMKGRGRAVMIPVEPLAQIGGIKMLFQICNERGSGKPLSLKQKKVHVPAGKWGTGRRLLAAAAAAAALGLAAWGAGSGESTGTTGSTGTAGSTGTTGGTGTTGSTETAEGSVQARMAMAEVSEEGTADSGENASQTAEHGNKAADKIQDGIMITVPDDTVFDQVGSDGTYVSSSLYYKIRLPQEEWTQQGNRDFGDVLVSEWGSILVRGYREQPQFFAIAGIDTPRTKADYIRRMESGAAVKDDSMPEVLEYTYRRVKGDEIVQKEIRYKAEENTGQIYGGGEYGEGAYRYSVELSVLGPEYFYTVTVRLREETPESIGEARRALDSFRILDTSAGICKKMEDEVFHGYYGKNYVMTNCLVLLEEDLSPEEIGDCLELVKKIDTGFFGVKSGDALAARTKDSPWLGIDSQSLQENCTMENARKVSKIFKSDVILYDEFDGDLLMVAYSDKHQKHVYQRATSFNKEILESEFGCYGKEQEFPEDILKYTDLTREEAEAIWTDPDAVFQMDKWYEITSHMTKMPVPEEFIGIRDYKEFKDGFEIIRR